MTNFKPKTLKGLIYALSTILEEKGDVRVGIWDDNFYNIEIDETIKDRLDFNLIKN